jgi:hypothetical protein
MSGTNETNGNNNNSLLPEPSGYVEVKRATNNHDKKWRLSMPAIAQNAQTFLTNDGRRILTTEELDQVRDATPGVVLQNLREQKLSDSSTPDNQ